MLMQKKEKRESKAVKSLPKVASSAKDIAAEKKNLRFNIDGEEITMEEMLLRSKEGGAGKGGRGVK